MFEETIQKQREYFNSGATRDIKKRIQWLDKLEKSIFDNEKALLDAFVQDYNKHEFDVLSNEVSLVIDEIHYMKKHIRSFFKGKKVHSNLINFPSSGKILPEPHGVCLIISPWNYPFQLSFVPLVDAIACGNTVVLKPSKMTPHVSKVMSDIVKDFDEELIKVFYGEEISSAQLLEQQFDFIFFTGSPRVGKIVMEQASHHLTPVVLELGGKSPVFITKNADLDLAAKRLAWGKFLNAGQTCVAPDYVLVDEKVKDAFVSSLLHYIKEFYYDRNNQLVDTFPYIITEKHVDRLKNLIAKDKVVYGNVIHDRQIEPTVLDKVTFDDPIMQEEIFGPILPILTYTDLESTIKSVQSRPRPLALYVFTKERKEAYHIMDQISFGGGCINDVIMHLSNPKLPFGGVGNSGMGSYHGAKSLITFTHQKSVFIKGKMEFNIKFAPITPKKLKLMKKFTKLK